MRKFLLISAAIGGLSVAPALADVDVNIGADVDTWASTYDAPAVTYSGDVAVGTTLPDSVTVVDVPNHKDLGFVHIGKKRVLVERKTNKIVKVYD